jgi:proteasome assembly chaperone (PAC2) family protein
MNPFKKPIVFIGAICLLGAAACSETSTKSTQEEIEIKTMDSTSKAIKENNEKLEDQTKKVEESLEKLDKEFENNK